MFTHEQPPSCGETKGRRTGARKSIFSLNSPASQGQGNAAVEETAISRLQYLR